jgi:outer membrane biogenesis lipoprotein LolB
VAAWSSSVRGALVRRITAAIGSVMLAAALSGCATPTPPAVAAPAVAVDADTPREWRGRFQVTLQAFDLERPPESTSGRFELLARGLALELALASPFGQTMALATRRADGTATLELADGRRVQTDSLDALLERALGYPLPVERLPAWLDRRFEHVVARDRTGEPVDALDSGWRIRMEPRRWQLQRPQGSGTLTVLLLLDR